MESLEKSPAIATGSHNPKAKVRGAGCSLPPWLAEAGFREKLERPAQAFARNSLSFRFAARLLPRDQFARVADVYAFCRFTDDLADAHHIDPEQRRERLEEWEELSRRVFDGHRSGLTLLDRVMADIRAQKMDFRYPALLFEGMHMDLSPHTYRTMADLDRYSTRVAGSVGMWLTQLVGIGDPTVLEEADRLGRALQLTNILRDVGEDWDRGRLYLPEECLRAWEIEPEEIGRWRLGEARIPEKYAHLSEALLRHAESQYACALKAVTALPAFFRPSVVSAAFIYRGIHAAIRRNGYDNLRRRARTGTREKFRHCARALLFLGGLHFLPSRVAQGPAAKKKPSLRSGLKAAALAAAGLLCHGNVLADTQLDDMRRAYLAAAVSREKLPAADSLARILEKSSGESVAQQATALAFTGAVAMLEAKYARWPGTKLKAVKAALPLLDSAVTLAPGNADARFLRHASTGPLPGFFGRKEGAREDGEWLARELASRADDHSSWWHARLVRHVIKEANPTPAQAEALRQSLSEKGESGNAGNHGRRSGDAPTPGEG